MKIAEVQDCEPVKLRREPLRLHLVGSKSDSGGVGVSAPVRPRQTKYHLDDGVRNWHVLNMEKCQPLPEGPRFMVLLYAEPLKSMNPSQAAGQRMIDLIGIKEVW